MSMLNYCLLMGLYLLPAIGIAGGISFWMRGQLAKHQWGRAGIELAVGGMALSVLGLNLWGISHLEWTTVYQGVEVNLFPFAALPWGVWFLASFERIWLLGRELAGLFSPGLFAEVLEGLLDGKGLEMSRQKWLPELHTYRRLRTHPKVRALMIGEASPKRLVQLGRDDTVAGFGQIIEQLMRQNDHESVVKLLEQASPAKLAWVSRTTLLPLIQHGKEKEWRQIAIRAAACGEGE